MIFLKSLRKLLERCLMMESENIVTGSYYSTLAMRTLIKAIILIFFVALVSLVNKTWLTDSNIIVGEVRDMLYWTGDNLVKRVSLSMADILGIYLGLKFLDLFIDLVYYGYRQWSTSFWKGKKYREQEQAE